MNRQTNPQTELERPSNSTFESTHARRIAALERQIRRVDAHIADLQRAAERLTWARLGSFFGGLVLSVIALFESGMLLFGIVAVISVIVFAVSVVQSRRVDNSIRRHTTWRTLKKTHIARMRIDWQNIPLPPLTSDHPLAIDLDLVGEYSIHHLIDTTISAQGSKRLADWLLTTEPDLTTISARQAEVRELIPRVLFRDKLALFSKTTARTFSTKWDTSRLLSWFTDDSVGKSSGKSASLTGALMVLIPWSVVNLGLLIAVSVAGLDPRVWILSVIFYFMAFFYLSRRSTDLFDNVLNARDSLERIRAVFTHLERWDYRGMEKIRVVCAPFLDPVNRPSTQLRRIGMITAAASVTRNPVLWMPINAVFPWDVFFGEVMNRAKARIAALLPGWLNAWYEVEALSALANYGYIAPRSTFPTFADSDPIIAAAQIGHPLLPADHKVCNDFTLDRMGQLVIITGSNMAGKSTFLRTLGVNLALGYAGAPVDADRFSARLMRPFTCIRVSDSVTDGFSYFYAEVRRLKALLNALNESHPLPLFFLIDEIFRGTNNRERLIGSRSYIRALTGNHGAGLISTHDLELVRLADENPHITNAHFREDVVNGTMVFDYTLREGPSPTTNALRIMRLEGLPVDDLAGITE
jgi:ABC-type multidrug transport system fused ATPase/permease subunit